MFFVQLAGMQIATHESRDALERSALPDVVRTVVLRRVSPSQTSRCESILNMTMAMLRCAGADLVNAPLEQGFYFDMKDWVQTYKPQLELIHEIASTLE